MYICRPEEGTRPHYRWLWATMWLPGIELRTFGRAGNALNHWAISPAPSPPIFKMHQLQSELPIYMYVAICLSGCDMIGLYPWRKLTSLPKQLSIANRNYPSLLNMLGTHLVWGTVHAVTIISQNPQDAASSKRSLIETQEINYSESPWNWPNRCVRPSHPVLYKQ